MKITFLCPLNLDQLTGTPIRTHTVIDIASTFAPISVVASKSNPKNYPLFVSNSPRLFSFWNTALKSLFSEKPDFIHCFTSLSVLPALVYKIFNPRTTFIFEMHGWSWSEATNLAFFKRLILTIFDVLGLFFADKVVAMSYSQKNFLASIVPWEKEISVLWGPVSFPFTYIPVEKRDKIVVGYLGNSSWWQGLSFLLEAARLLTKDNRVSFYIAGFDFSDSSQFPILENVRYGGKIQRQEVLTSLQNCDVLVSPRLGGSVSDLQYPQKLSEYMSSGRAVIVSPVSDQPKIVNESGAGLVMEDVTAEHIKSSILKILEMPFEEREMMGYMSFKFAQNNFSREAFAQKLKSVYSKN